MSTPAKVIFFANQIEDKAKKYRYNVAQVDIEPIKQKVIRHKKRGGNEEENVYYVDDKAKPKKRLLAASNQDWSQINELFQDPKFKKHLDDEKYLQKELIQRNDRRMQSKQIEEVNLQLKKFDIQNNIDRTLLRDDKYLSLCRFKPVESKIFDRALMSRIMRQKTNKIEDEQSIRIISNKCARFQKNNRNFDENLLKGIYAPIYKMEDIVEETNDPVKKLEAISAAIIEQQLKTVVFEDEVKQ